MKYLYIYPNKEQLECINKLKMQDVTIVDRNNAFCIDFNEIKYNYDNYKIMCCNEEALYYFYKFLNFQKNSKISNSCLELYDKYKSNRIFKQRQINYIDKSKTPIKYPFIAKPNFGFASIGVKKINNSKELNEYLNDFNSYISNSEIGKLKKIYFEDLQVYPIYEAEIDYGYFFSVPFIFDKENDEITIFPVQGCEKISTINSNFYWKKFIYDEASINNTIYNSIKLCMHDIANKFELNTSVNMAEVIYDIHTDQVKVVEFSPRVPGGRLSQLIYYGSGVNLNELSIKLFNNESYIINKKSIPVILNINFDIDNGNNDVFMSEIVYSNIFQQDIKYEIYKYEYQKIGLIPGRFAPPHKGHFSVFEKAIKEMDKVVIMIFDTEDIAVPLHIRANWIKKFFPQVQIIEAHDCPDGKKYAYELGQECANVQNDYIKKLLGDIKITHVYHSNPCGDSLSKSLNARDIVVDIDRKKQPISGTMIRNDLKKYENYLEKYIFEEYSKYKLK